MLGDPVGFVDPEGLSSIVDDIAQWALGIPTQAMIKETLYPQCGAYGFDCKDTVGTYWNKCQAGTLKCDDCEEK